MTVKRVFALMLRLAALTALFAVCLTLANGIALPPIDADLLSPEQVNQAGLALLAVSFVNSAVLAHVILRSRWAGLKLTATVFVVLYGIMYFLSQIETAAFPAAANRLPAGMLRGLFVAGLILAAAYAPLAVLILGRWRIAPAGGGSNERLAMPAREWGWKLAIIAGAYVTLYFTFGYYVAWRNPAVTAYYGGTDPGSFWLQMRSVMATTPWLPFLQILRAMLWTLIALPVIRMMKGRAWETALALGLLFAVLMNSQHLFPNPFMPREVSTAHLIETASSNFVFGLVVGGLLLWRPGRAGPAPTR